VLDDRLELLHCFIDKQDPAFVQPASQLLSLGTRGLSIAISSKELCREYLLSYTVFCAYSLTAYLIIILMFSEMYMRRLLGKVLDKEIDLEWKEEEDLEQQEQDDKDDEDDYLEETLAEKNSLQNQENKRQNGNINSPIHNEKPGSIKINSGSEPLSDQEKNSINIVRAEGEKNKDLEYRSRVVICASNATKDWDARNTARSDDITARQRIMTSNFTQKERPLSYPSSYLSQKNGRQRSSRALSVAPGRARSGIYIYMYIYTYEYLKNRQKSSRALSLAPVRARSGLYHTFSLLFF
jgi:hypothetical protein